MNMNDRALHRIHKIHTRHRAQIKPASNNTVIFQTIINIDELSKRKTYNNHQCFIVSNQL